MIYPSVEAAYQAAKTLNMNLRTPFTRLAAGRAKSAGRKLKLRSDWESVKLPIMAELLHTKFKHLDLQASLKATGDTALIEGNWWGDTFWGVCDGIGENWLGKLLMAEREKIIRIF